MDLRPIYNARVMGARVSRVDNRESTTRKETNMGIAIITGGSRGLGRSMALHLAPKGDDVILTYNSKKAEAEAVVGEIEKAGRKGASLQLDVSNSKVFPAFADSVRGVL